MNSTLCLLASLAVVIGMTTGANAGESSALPGVPDGLRIDYVAATPAESVTEPAAGGAAAAPSGKSAADLAKAAQNPVADMISLPFQYNLYFGVGQSNDVAGVLNIQPVIPVNVGSVNIINRIILPVIHVPNSVFGLPGELSEGSGNEVGMGDINYTAFFSPAKPGKVIWGIGPSINLPTATSDELGSGKLSLGISAVVLTMQDQWVYGVLVRNLWSVGGDSDRRDVNQFLMQPFVSYNLPDGWYITSSPVITANWNADDVWTVPIGGGFGRTFRIGKQPVNMSFQAFYHVIRPDNAPDWSLRFQVQLLFPK